MVKNCSCEKSPRDVVPQNYGGGAPAPGALLLTMSLYRTVHPFLATSSSFTLSQMDIRMSTCSAAEH